MTRDNTDDDAPTDDRPWDDAEEQAECPLCEGTVDVWFEGFRFDTRSDLRLGVDSNCRDCPFTYHGSLPVEKEGGFVALVGGGHTELSGRLSDEEVEE